MKIAKFKNIAWSLKQLFTAAPFEICLLLIFIIFQGLIPAASLYAIQGIIQWISSSSDFPLLFVSLWGGMLFVDIVSNPITSIVRLQLNEKMLAFCHILLMEKANAIQGLNTFENPRLYDEIQFLKKESSAKPINLIYVVTGFIKEGVSLISISLVLSFLSWWIPIAMLLGTLPHALSTLWFEKQAWDQMLFRSPESRRLAWISSLTLNDQIAKEIRLFGFGRFLIQKYQDASKNLHQALSKERWRKSLLLIFLSSLTVICYITVISIVLLQTKNKVLEISSLVLVIQSLVMIQSQLMGCISYLGMTTPILLFFSKLRHFLESSPCSVSNGLSGNIPVFQHEIAFENVSFSYPDGRKVLSHVNFKIMKGEKIAIVGQNGAGKSTIVKLLLRFYDPSDGLITVDGKDLKTLDILSWRASISGVFQDFGQYHFTAQENIYLANVHASQEAVIDASKKGGFFLVLNKLPEGLNTLLGKEFGGTSLSGGEWQKLAMSRAFLRDANLLILDEPTSSLDPQSELEVFKKFAEAAVNKTTLFITHRLGSAKMADRILVFKDGCLIEEGSHEKLFSANQEYASIFQMQADLYAHSQKL